MLDESSAGLRDAGEVAQIPHMAYEGAQDSQAQGLKNRRHTTAQTKTQRIIGTIKTARLQAWYVVLQMAFEGALAFALNNGKQLILLTPLPIDFVDKLKEALTLRASLPQMPPDFLRINQMPAARPQNQ